MASERPTAGAENVNEAVDLAKAFQELAEGERQATALENQLSKMEAKIEELLAQAETNEEALRRIEEAAPATNGEKSS